MWVKTAGAERMLRRAINSEKPAHTAYDLVLVEPRFQIGRQSTIGYDTIIGVYPVTRLAPTSEEAMPDDECLAPSRVPRTPRLGYDTVLTAAPSASRGMGLNPVTRIGLDSILT